MMFGKLPWLNCSNFYVCRLTQRKSQRLQYSLRQCLTDWMKALVWLIMTRWFFLLNYFILWGIRLFGSLDNFYIVIHVSWSGQSACIFYVCQLCQSKEMVSYCIVYACFISLSEVKLFQDELLLTPCIAKLHSLLLNSWRKVPFFLGQSWL